MYSDAIAFLMVTETTRRRLTEPLPEKQPRAPRRTAARVLHAVARRLDPAVARTSTAAG